MIFTSILGIVTLIALAWALGFRTETRLTDAGAAAAEASRAIPNFEAIEAAVSDDTKSALVAARDGRTALVRTFADRYVVRLLQGAHVRLDGEVLHLRLSEPGFPKVALTLGAQAPKWAARL
jgi:RNase P/RNase MRP subunit p29